MRLPDSVGDRDVRWELVEGQPVEIVPEAFEHNRVRDNVLMALLNYADRKRNGTAVGMQHFRLSGGTVRRPDISFVRAGRELPLDKLPEGAPDLAIEVISPSNTPREIEQRISDYFAAGCKRVWVIHPEHQEVYIHGLAGVTRRHGNEILEDAELLGSFSVRVSEFFVESNQ